MTQSWRKPRARSLDQPRVPVGDSRRLSRYHGVHGIGARSSHSESHFAGALRAALGSGLSGLSVVQRRARRKHEGGETPFTFDVTDDHSPGEPNLI